MNSKRNIKAIFYALLAATLYAFNIPFSKVLLKVIPPTMMASYLYLGAGIGIGFISLFSCKNTNKENITKKDLPYVIGMVVLDILAPILLMFGLIGTNSSSATLLNNFEIICTSLVALLIFKEFISKKMWMAIILIFISSFILLVDDFDSFKFSWSSILVLLATVCWGFENNCTKCLANKNTYTIVFIKGLFCGACSLVIAIFTKESFPSLKYILIAMILGFIAYGLSIFFYIKSQGIIGASKTSAYYSVSPFIGTFLSFIIFKDELNWPYFISLVIMIIGTILVIFDTLRKDVTKNDN